MEPRGCNRWQPVASPKAPRRPKTSENRAVDWTSCLSRSWQAGRLPWAAAVAGDPPPCEGGGRPSSWFAAATSCCCTPGMGTGRSRSRCMPRGSWLDSTRCSFARLARRRASRPLQQASQQPSPRQLSRLCSIVGGSGRPCSRGQPRSRSSRGGRAFGTIACAAARARRVPEDELGRMPDLPFERVVAVA
jgi:hypothetical protein